MKTFIASLAAILLCQIQAWAAPAWETTYWVWHRESPLSAEEVRGLGRQSIRKLYWHAGTLRAGGSAWILEGRLQLPSNAVAASLAIVPVLRLSIDGAMPLEEAASESVSAVLAEALQQSGASEAQIDFDCPDRRLAEYAVFLARCRARIAPAKLSVTALAGWSRSPAFENLQASADLLLPMFYDLLPDRPSDVCEGRVLPLVDAGSMAKQLASWRACRVPWLAGLPNFARVTIFDASGRSRGHLRAWDWDAICFSPNLELRSPSVSGVTLFTVVSDTVIADTPVKKGETVACRWPDPAQLVTAISALKNSGASGLALFRLPGSGTQGGWSLRQLETLLREDQAGQPDLKVRRALHGLEVSNVSESDLPPRLAGPDGPRDRGWQIEVESSAGAVFREANPGEFAHVFAHADPDAAEPRLVATPLAQRLTYWFSELRAGQSRQTGLLQLAPDAAFSSLRWRLRGSAQIFPWQPIE